MPLRARSRSSGGSASSSPGTSSFGTAAESVWVLIADDSSAVQVALKRLVRTVGKNILGVAPQVQCVCDGVDALKALEKRDYSLVLMDLHMPRMGGVQATREIRKRYSSNELPILAVTAESDPDYLLCQGFNGVVEKPVTAPVFLPLLQRFLWQHQPGAVESSQNSDSDASSPMHMSTGEQQMQSGASMGSMDPVAEGLVIDVTRVLHTAMVVS